MTSSQYDKHKRPIMKFIKNPINHFIQLETSGSILLFAATVLALILANSPLGPAFLHFWEHKITISLPGFELSKSIHHWINDGLMAIFFFLIGLEIKREIMVGELNELRKITLPLFAAVGGMITPALLFLFLNKGNAGQEGWGIPMAADIAFALGILTLLGKRIPIGVKLFLMAFAIIDDLGAVLVIAFFYSNNLFWYNIFIALGIVAFLWFLTHRNFFSKYLFYTAGIIVWVLFLKSGIHATIAGVLMATTIPLKRKTDTRIFIQRSRELLDIIYNECKAGTVGQQELLSKRQLHALDELEDLTERTTSPLQHNEHALHGWVSYLIMPLFAFANAGVVFSFSADTNLTLSGNIAASMVIGNFIGIFSFSWLSIKLGLAQLPQNVNFKHLAGVSILGGLGFTMSLFINSLAYTDPHLINSAKMGILTGSLIAGILGYLSIRFTCRETEQ